MYEFYLHLQIYYVNATKIFGNLCLSTINLEPVQGHFVACSQNYNLLK